MNSDSRQRARERAADGIATRWDVMCDLATSGFKPLKDRCGTYSGYAAGCRCRRCLDAKAAYQRAQYARRKASR